MKTDNLFEQIDALLLDWGESRRLYYGGCCTGVYEVSRLLEEYLIPYSVLMYVDHESCNLKTPEAICQNNGCLHMSIVVDYKGSKCTLGVDERFDDLILKYGAVVRTFKKMTSDRLKNLSETCEWMGEYDHVNDVELRNTLEKIFEKNL